MSTRQVRAVLRTLEGVVWGGTMRQRLLLRLLEGHIASVKRRDWIWSEPERAPHFFDHRLGMIEVALGPVTPMGYLRGYLTAETVGPRDVLLDIGCGDGFFARRFYAPRCAAVDAIDIDEQAIRSAHRHHAGANVTYARLDAVLEPFPRDHYDVVVWDGALGHFSAEDSQRVLAKVSRSLSPSGVFVGSESLGSEGADHLQFFSDLAELRELLEAQFAHVLLRLVDYELPGGLARREAFWRCATSERGLRRGAWETDSTAAEET